MAQSSLKTITTGLASVGRIESTISLVVAIIIGIIALAVGIYLITQNQNNTANVTGTVTGGQCSMVRGTKGSISYNCNLTVTYTVNNVVYTQPVSGSTTQQYVIGNTVNLSYNVNKPSVVQFKSAVSAHTAGYILIAVGVCCLLFGGLKYYFIHKSKTLAALDGLGTVARII